MTFISFLGLFGLLWFYITEVFSGFKNSWSNLLRSVVDQSLSDYCSCTFKEKIVKFISTRLYE